MMLIFLAIPRSTDMWTADRTLDVLMQKSVSVIGHLPMAQSELSIVELVVTDASLVVTLLPRNERPSETRRHEYTGDENATTGTVTSNGQVHMLKAYT
jgi:hypothetical protein